MRAAALALMAASPGGAQDARSVTYEAIECGGAALALRLLREREADEGLQTARAEAEAAQDAYLGIGLHAARRTGCGMGQITYEVGAALASYQRLRALEAATPDGIGFTAETRRVEAEVETCLAERGGIESLSRLAEPRDIRGRIEPCSWRE